VDVAQKSGGIAGVLFLFLLLLVGGGVAAFFFSPEAKEFMIPWLAKAGIQVEKQETKVKEVAAPPIKPKPVVEDKFAKPIKPFSKKMGETKIGVVKLDGPISMPLISWGGDVVTFFANGGAETGKDSLFEKQGLKLKLKLQDNFVEQVQAYMKGETPFLRGTLGMINTASEVLSADPRTKPVVILQETWSTGGDCLVVRGINQVKDLKGKKVVLQRYSPHVDFLGKVLDDAGLSMKDIEVVWVKELTGGKDDPASTFKADKSISAAFCISPDAVALVSADAEGDSTILFDTRTANRMIADVLAVRKDFFEANKEVLKKLAFAYMEAASGAKELTQDTTFMGKAAAFFMGDAGKTDDIKGLLADCTLQGKDDNFSFFAHKGNRVGFEPTNKRLQGFLKAEGYLNKSVELEHAGWEYGIAADEIKVKREHPAKESLPETVVTLFEFQINFEPNQSKFSSEKYGKDFERTLDLASHYGGAMLEIVGHVDPSKLNQMKAKKQRARLIKRMEKRVLTLSAQRAGTVKDAILKHAKEQGDLFDESQFLVSGKGVAEPINPEPKSDEEKSKNRRVVFRVLNVLIE